MRNNSYYRRDLSSISKSLKKVNKFGKVMASAGLVINGAILVDKYANGPGINAADAVDFGIAIALTVVAVSNPIGIVALAVYGFVDGAGYLDGLKEKLGGNTIILSRDN